ncbi:conserved hypothetical protein [Mycobacterium marinum M]|uniref:Helix-turn-helix domain-containing protein n=1 Tax=Mycobacterium marinum (strain ATCC BAA-535 / M) TaxID=216594 RepID=B2HI74_MYCMM|nr:hypothetical protein [Mycobacterium marinum]ACC38500.1 conserved hypothetical protein [Mycobacterium marinum M]
MEAGILKREITPNGPQAGRPTTSVPAAARLLGIDVRTVRARIARGELAGGAVAKNRRLRWFVYSDALLTDVGYNDDQRADAGQSSIKKAASLLLQAHAELQAGLGRDSKGIDHLGRARAELIAHKKAVTKSFDHLQAALALIDDWPSDQGHNGENGTP